MADLDHPALDDHAHATLDELARSFPGDVPDGGATEPVRSSDRRVLAAESDFRFRQMFGGYLWHQHHVHAHHLMSGNLPPAP